MKPDWKRLSKSLLPWAFWLTKCEMSYPPIRKRSTTAGASTCYPSTFQPTNSQSTPSRNVQPQPAYRSTPPQVYHHPHTYSPGPLPFFLPPPGQPTTDPTYSTPLTSQALRTTYPSRVRTGVTGLVQPENITGGPKERQYFLAELDRELLTARPASGASTPRYHSPARGRTTLFGRRTGRGGAVNYVDQGSDDDEEGDEDDEVGEAASDPEDRDDGGGGGGRKRRAGWGIGAAEQQAAMRMGKLRKKREELDRGWTWLGDRVPGERVRGQAVRATKHQYVWVSLFPCALIFSWN